MSTVIYHIAMSHILRNGNKKKQFDMPQYYYKSYYLHAICTVLQNINKTCLFCSVVGVAYK